MISCGWASTMTSVMLIWKSRSMTGMIQLKPDLAKRLYLPRRSIRPRWVGRTMRMPDRKMMTRKTPTPIPILVSHMVIPP